MSVRPETALATWAVGTAWLLVYVLTHYTHHQLAYGLNAMWVIRGASVVLGLVLFLPLRKWFRVWLSRARSI